jgi:putative DNA (cytosine-5-)-methyltransferase
MNAIEIEQAVSELFSQPYDATEFPYQFLEAFGNPKTTLKRLRASESNKSDCGGVLQRNHIHILTCAPGETTTALATLQQSATNAKNKVNYLLVTDGEQINATDLQSGEPLVCDYADFPNHFGFFLGLANIRTVKAIRDSAFDIRATAKLNRLYVQLLKDNPDWAKAERRHDMNHFMARLIFCFFAEDTDIFNGDNLFSATLQQMSAADGGDLEHVIGEIFRAMNTKIENRGTANLRPWADAFPYVNGGLFSDAPAVPRFNKTTRAYLLQIGLLDWTKINPDIFGSMIQAVADEEERGELGMHYTSVPNILKVLNPLFLDALRAKLADAGDNKIKLLNLRKRIARIRVFDPACGSGNFLVIAYKELRHIENQINQRRDEAQRKSDIPLTNFRGIEIRDFSAEIARLALIIAEYQANVQYLGQMEALAEFLPLSSQNWITCGNALRLNWLAICPPNGTTVKHTADDLFATPLEQSEIDFENEGGETYICGNPPYLGSTWQSSEQKADLQATFAHRCKNWKSLDYVAGWFIKAADYMQQDENSATAFVSTNSICQGQQVPILWPLLFASGLHITFAHTSFKWANLASHNAGVTVTIIGISRRNGSPRRLYSHDEQGKPIVKEAANINAYLVPGANIIVGKASSPISEQSAMDFGNKPVDGGNLLMSRREMQALQLTTAEQARYIRRFYGSAEFIRGEMRYCLWLSDADLTYAEQHPAIAQRIAAVRAMRLASPKAQTVEIAATPHRFGEVRQIGNERSIVVPRVSSENRDYLPVGYLETAIIADAAFALYDAPLWNMALIASRLHLVWIATVCGKLKTDFRYSNTLGWNTFPVPPLTEQHKADLTESAAAILLAREMHFPKTIAGLYAPGAMPENLRHAHERNDEILERIYIGRRFKNDSERLEKLFALYSEMAAQKNVVKSKKPRKKKTVPPQGES